MSAAEEHVHALTRRNESLEKKAAKLKARATAAAKHGIETGEIMLGAAIGGLLQGMAKDQEKGPRIAHIPADLALGIGGLALGAFDVAGDYSRDVANVSKGFLAAFATDFGHAIGVRKRTSGSFFPKKHAPGAIAAGAPNPQAMADTILKQMQG